MDDVKEGETTACMPHIGSRWGQLALQHKNIMLGKPSTLHSGCCPRPAVVAAADSRGPAGGGADSLGRASGQPAGG